MLSTLDLTCVLVIGTMDCFLAECWDRAHAANMSTRSATTASTSLGAPSAGSGSAASVTFAAGPTPPAASSASRAAPAVSSPGHPPETDRQLDRLRDYLVGRGDPDAARRAELRREQNEAREAEALGQIRPFEAILSAVNTAYPGELLSARLEKDPAGVWTYRLVVLSGNGRYQQIVVDAEKNLIREVR